MKKITEAQLKNRVNGLREYIAILSEEGAGNDTPSVIQDLQKAKAAAAPAAPAAGAPADNRNIFQKGVDAVSDFHKKNTERFYAKQAADAVANSPEGMAAAKAKLTPSQLAWLGKATPSPEILQRVPEPTAQEKADAAAQASKIANRMDAEAGANTVGTPAAQKVDPDQAEKDDVQLGADMRANAAGGNSTSAATGVGNPGEEAAAELARMKQLAGTPTPTPTPGADHGTPYDDEGNMMPGWSKDENNNPVWVGDQDGKTFVEPATQALANQARQNAKEKEIGDNQDREDQERGRDPAQDAYGNHIAISSTQTATPEPAKQTFSQAFRAARNLQMKKDPKNPGAGRFTWDGKPGVTFTTALDTEKAPKATTAPATPPTSRGMEIPNVPKTVPAVPTIPAPELSQFTNVPYPPTPRPMNVKPLPGRMPAKESVTYADDQTLARIVSLGRR